MTNLWYDCAARRTCSVFSLKGRPCVVNNKLCNYSDSNSACSAIPSGDLIAGDFIRIRCVINYNGSQSPYMRWTDNSTGFPISNETTSTFPTQVNSFIDVPVYPPTSRPYTCRTFFDPPITYTFQWTLPTLYVQCMSVFNTLISAPFK